MKARYFTSLQNSLRFSRRSALSVAALMVFSNQSAHAVDYYWDADGDTTAGTGGSGSWTTTTALWRNGSVTGPLENWVNSNVAVLGGTAGTLTTNEAIVATRITVDSTATGTFAITNGVGGTLSITAGVLDVAVGKSLTFSSVVAGTGLTTVQGGGTVTFSASNRAYGGNLISSGAGTNLIFSNTNGLDNGTATIGLTARDGGTITVNGTNNYRAGLVLGGAGFGGGTVKLGHVQSFVRQNTMSVSVSGTSQSTILSTLANTGTTFGGFNFGGTALGATFTVAATGDPSGVDLEFSAGGKNGILTKAGVGVVRLNAGFILNNANDYTTFNNAANAVSVTAGTFLNEGTIKSITSITGATSILQTGATGIFDQVNLNGGIFEVSRTSGLFTTGLTYAAGKNAINFNGGTLKYVGVNTDYSSQFTFGTLGGTVDTNTQNVTFATALTDTGPFTKAGAGTLTLAAPNALSGAISVTGGTLDLGGFATSVGSLASGITAGDLVLGSSILTIGSANTNTTYAGNISGVGASLVKNGTGVQTLSGSNTYTGGTSVNSGILVFATTAAKPATGTVTVAAGASLGLGVGGTGFFTAADLNSLAANTLPNVNLDPAAGVAIDTSAGNFSYAPTQSTRFLTKVGANTLTLSGTASFTGTTSVFAGTLKYANPGSLYNGDTTQWTAANISVNSGATLAVNIGGTGTFSDAQVDTLITNLSTINSNGLKAGSNFGFDTTNATSAITYSHILANPTGTGSGAVGITKLGAGTLILDQANTYTGTTTVAAGSLTLSGARTAASGVFSVGNLAGNTGTLNIQTGTYALGANSFFVGTGDTAVGVVNQTGGDVSFTGGNRLLIGNGGNSTGTYNLSGGTLSTTGTGAFIRLGVNTGTGNPTSTFNLSGTGIINAGTSTVEIGRSDSANVSNTINFFNQTGGTANLGTLTMGGGAGVAATAANIQATLDLSAGMFTATTFGSLSAADANTSTIIIRGTALVNLPKFGTNTALGAGSTAVVKFNGGTLLPTAANTNYLNVVTTALVQAGGAKIDVATGNNITITQALQQDPTSTGGGLTKLGLGVLTLTGANTYTGNTTVSEGILSLGSPSLADASNLTIATGATLDLTHSQTDIVKSLTLGGTTYTSGTFNASTPVAAGFITGTGTIQVSAVAPSGFAAYINGFGSIPSDKKGANDDPDSDGISNLLEYALNGNPSVSNTSILPKLALTATDFEFTYTRLDLSLADTAQSFQYGSNLTGWTSIPIPAAIGSSTAGIATITITDTGSTDAVKVSIPRSAAAGGKLFGRLQVVK